MSPQVLQRKLLTLASYLEELRTIAPARADELMSDPRTRRAVERLLQLIVEVGADICEHWLVEEGHPAPDDYFSCFKNAGEKGLLSIDLACRIAPSAGLRNILVHEYEDIDLNELFISIDLALSYYGEFLAEVRRQLPRSKEQ